MSRPQRTFERPYRAPGLRLADALGRPFERIGLRRRVDAGKIVRRAERHAGLRIPPHVAEPIELLAADYEKEAEPTPSGRALFRLGLRHFLDNRLRLETWLAAHPEVERRPIARPIFVVGLPRSGTTLLQNLLACDPRARPLLAWESFQPIPREGRRDRRILRARIGLGAFQRFAPDLRTIHPIEATSPEESTWLMANTFVTSAFELLGRAPAYHAWRFGLPREAHVRAYGELRRQLQVLDAQRPARGHWVLKSPVHLESLDALLEVFPDAAIVRMERDLHEVVPSTCSLFAVVRSIFSDRVEPTALGQEVADLLVRTFERAAQVADRHPTRVISISYEALVADKIGTVRRIYDHFGYACDGEYTVALRRFLHSDPHRGGHRYDLSQFGLTTDDLTSRFGRAARVPAAG